MRGIGNSLVIAIKHLAGHWRAREGREGWKHRKAFNPHPGKALGLGCGAARRAGNNTRKKGHTPPNHAKAGANHLILLVFAQRNHFGGIHIHGDTRWILVGKPVHVTL